MYWFKERKAELFGIFGTILFSIVLFLVMGNGNLNFGLFDDNQAQWLPVIDRAYQTLLETGRLPVIDFFQMRGMKIYDQGYYGLWNPFMLIAYLLRTYLLFFLNTNTISVYIFMMVLLGNLCCYRIFREYGISISASVLCSSCLMSVSVYVALSYWYYVYNVYFILSWLLLRILKQQDKQSYYEYGAILALSLFMGNIQYTAYMYLSFAFIMLVLFYGKERRALGKLLSNTVCMGILCLIPLLLLLQASSKTLNFSGNNAEYYSSAIHCLIFALFSWFPSSFLGSVGEGVESLIYTKVPLPDTGFFPGVRSVYMGVMACAVVIFLFCRKKYKNDKFYEITYACLVSAGILLLLSFGKTGLLAIFVGQIPFLNSFRILSKYLVLIPPLLIPCMAIVLRKERSFWNRYTVIFIMFAIFGVLHNRQIAFGTPQIQSGSGIQRLEELKADYHNYRILGFASWREIELFYPQWEEFYQREKISYEEKFSKNAATAAGVITTGGYDLAFDYKQFQMSDSILGTISGYASEFGYANMVIEENFIERYQKENVGYWPNLIKLREQIIDNSIKYFIFTKDSACYIHFMELLEDMHLSVEWEQDFLEHTVILSIADIMPVIQDRDGMKVDAHVTMDKIFFRPYGNHEFRIGMYYDENLCAYYIDQNEQRIPLSVLPDEKGYILVSGIPDSGNGTVEITYHNNMYLSGMIWNMIALAVIIIMLFTPEIKNIKKIVCYWDEKTKVLLKYFSSISPEKYIWYFFGILLCLYIGFLAFYYLHTKCTVPDEDWFLQMFCSIRQKAKGNIFAYLGETENYLGYGQIYWIFGSICSNILLLRVITYCMLIGSMCLTLKEVRCLYGVRMIPYAGILWISMPYAWYSDKIIGPEILGLFLGILGLCILNGKRHRWIGWCLLGISSAVKMNYMVFMMAALLLEMKLGKDNRIMLLVKGMLLSLCGFILANPIMLWDIHTYMDNMIMDNRIMLEVLSYVFERREHEWDSVMVNGVFWGYVSAFLFFAVIFVQMIQKKYRKKAIGDSLLQRNNYYYGNITGILSLFLVFICCREVFLGWYLLPLCYLITIFICSRFYHEDKETKARNLNYWLFALCLFINGMILLPEHISNRENNIAYMQMVADSDKVQEEIDSVKEVIEEKKPNTQWYNLLDFHMGGYSYNHKDYVDFCVTGVEGIAVIGERMRCVDRIEEIVGKAIREEEGLCVLWQEKGVWIIERGNL